MYKEINSLRHVKVMHFSVKDKTNVSDKILIWKEMNPGYTVVLYDNDDITHFFQNEYPEFLQLAKNLPSIVEVVDLWRYLVIYRFGGLYSDTDLQPNIAIDKWLTDQEKNCNMALVSVESTNNDGNINLFLQWYR